MPTQEVALTHYSADLTDPRINRTKKHQLLDILALTLCATIAGADSWEEVERFGKAKHGWLKRFLRLPNGIPSHDTFDRVFAALDPQQFADVSLDVFQERARDVLKSFGQVTPELFAHAADTGGDMALRPMSQGLARDTQLAGSALPVAGVRVEAGQGGGLFLISVASCGHGFATKKRLVHRWRASSRACASPHSRGEKNLLFYHACASCLVAPSPVPEGARGSPEAFLGAIRIK
jgi:hypothetical protein